MNLFEKYKAIQEIGEIEVPHHVWRLFRERPYSLQIAGDQVCFGEDFVELREARAAVEWYVKQLGGSVKWAREARGKK